MTDPKLQSAPHDSGRFGLVEGLVPSTSLGWFCLLLSSFLAAWTMIGVHRFDSAYRWLLLVWFGAVLIFAYRLFTGRLMWQLRNRLIVTYVFIGVIPLVLLATMAMAAAYLFAGEFSTFEVTTDIDSALHRLEISNRNIFQQTAATLRRHGSIEPNKLVISDDSFPGRRVVAFYRGHAQALLDGAYGEELTPPLPGLPEAVVVVDHGSLFLRAIQHGPLSNSAPADSPANSSKGDLVVVSSIPLDESHLASIVANVGIVTVYGERSAGDTSWSQTKARIRVGDTGMDVDAVPKIVSGSMPAPLFSMDLAIGPAFTILNTVHWKTGQPGMLLLTVRTRPSLLYNRLFRNLGEANSLGDHLTYRVSNDMSADNSMLIALAVIAVVFAFIEVVAFVIGVRLTRTMTSSVAKLYDATQHVNRGDFSHRIRVRSRDQLASLESSFNSMTESLEALIAEQKEKQRIESELSIAKEVQDLLYPGDAADLDGLELHGVCRPARTVSGDYYDFLPVCATAVGLAVGDISGKGISAALMMASVQAFVRAHSQMGVSSTLAVSSLAPAVAEVCPSPGAILALLNQQLYISTPAAKYATMFLGFYDQSRRLFTYSNAGHLPPILLRADGQIERLDEGGTVVGLFADMGYAEGRVSLRSGDIAIAFSDGITEPENDFGEFGEERLIQIVRENRELPLPRISEAIFNAVVDWIGGAEQPDDMTIVLARAR